jgi:hypothetical protein
MKKIIIYVSLIIFCACTQTGKKSNIVEEDIASVEWGVENLANEESFTTENSSRTNTNSVENFVKHLMNEEKLHSFFSDNWTFIYHEDNRCDGSTDGEKSNLSNFDIDEIIKIKVVNDGDGWACEKTDITEFHLDFSLKKIVKRTFENPELEYRKKNIVYVIGSVAGTHYLILYYDDNGLIVKMEYRGEDPG